MGDENRLCTFGTDVGVMEYVPGTCMRGTYFTSDGDRIGVQTRYEVARNREEV